jgi:hypothetical protein
MGSSAFEQMHFGETVLNPIGLVAVLVLGATMLVVPRRYAVWPMIAIACFIAPAQRIAILSLNFDLLRLMVVFGAARLIIHSEWAGLRWNPLDTAVVAWTAVGTVAYIVFYASGDAVKYRLGTSFDALGMYFLFRCLVRGWDDIETIVAGFVVMSVPVTAAFMLEHSTGRNVFAFLGGVPEFTDIRDGRLRCQGAFAHPILAGCFWAAVLPLVAAQWWRGPAGRKWAITGGCTCVALILLCASSTPVAAVIFAAVAALFFPLRNQMRQIRWSLLGVAILLHLAMKNPIWHLIARADFVGGSTGWHRFHLIDEAVHHFGEWCLLGTDDTGHWGFGLEDVTNQYVLEGVRGGALTLVLFIVVISLAFGGVGRSVRAATTVRRRALGWALGVSLFVHCTNFIGVSYFAQINMLWYLTLAMIGSVSVTQGAVRILARRTRRVRSGRRTGAMSVTGRRALPRWA